MRFHSLRLIHYQGRNAKSSPQGARQSVSRRKAYHPLISKAQTSIRRANADILFRLATRLLLAAISGILLFPALLGAQPLPRRALSIFPADTEQFAYVNLLELRRLPKYAQIHQRLLGRQLRDFEDFLRSLSINPEGDVDEVVLGWRGQKLEGGAFFSLVEGRFQPAAARAFFAQQGLPLREYAGQDLFAFGSGEAPQDLFFTFLSSSSAAFGRLNDLQAMLEVRARTRMALDSNETFVNWEAELEGSTPQWGIVAGKAVAVQGKALLAGGPTLPVKPNALTKLIDAILYAIVKFRSLDGKCDGGPDHVRLRFFQEVDRHPDVCSGLIGISEQDEESGLHPKFFGNTRGLTDLRNSSSFAHAVENLLRAGLGAVPDPETTGLAQPLQDAAIDEIDT